MSKEFTLEYTAIDRETCEGVTLKDNKNVCHGWSLDLGSNEQKIICDMAKCPLLAKVALGEVLND